MWLLLACASPPADDSAPPDSAPADDTAPPPDTAADCPTLTGLTVSGRPVPGETLLVVAEGDGEGLDWSVEAGVVEAVDARTASWSLPVDVAADVAAALEVVARARAPCEGEARAEVTVDWPVEDRVVVIYNPAVDGSERVARAYQAARALPDAALCPIEASHDTEIAAEEWAAFAAAAQACLDARGPQVHYVVPVWGVPFKVSGLVADIAYGTPVTVSLDALLVYGIDGATADEAIWSPLYLEGDSVTGVYTPYEPFGALRRSLRRWDHLYLVARIDGDGEAGALALIARTLDAEARVASGGLSGTAYVDARFGEVPPATDEPGSYEAGEWNLWGAARVVEADGRLPLVFDTHAEEFGTAPAPTACPDALLYAGWYSVHTYYDVYTWEVGAVGGHLDSFSADDIRGGQSWSARALQAGITATFGAVNEPYVLGMPEYDQLFLYLLQGATFGEAAYESTAVGRWMMLYVGDPLYRPFPA